MPDEPIRQEVFTAGQLRLAAVLGTLGMFTVLAVLLILMTSRPQGQFRVLDDSQHQAQLARAQERLQGFEAFEDGAARLDIEHAMRLVVERGVDLPLVAGGVVPVAAEPAVPAEDVDELLATPLDGAPIYGANCAACHQATGAGIPGAFPPLANHVYELYAADRDLPILIVMYGLQGPIEVHGQRYDGLMPAFGQLDDGEIAAVLNHVMTAWNDAEQLDEEFEPYEAADVAEQRGQGLSGSAVHAIRQELGLP